jgi:hypothetical protein
LPRLIPRSTRARARCIFPRAGVLIGALPLSEGPAVSAQIKAGAKSWAVASHAGRSCWPKNCCEKHFGACSRPLQMGKRLASSFLVSDPRAVLEFWGFWLESSPEPSLFTPAFQTQVREKIAPLAPCLGRGAVFSLEKDPRRFKSCVKLNNRTSGHYFLLGGLFKSPRNLEMGPTARDGASWAPRAGCLVGNTTRLFAQ